MNRGPDFRRVQQALADAIAALPVTGCRHGQARLRRECQELVLLLLHAKERAQGLEEMFGADPPDGAVT